ncbi:hypothetical protein [Paenibacillus sp. RUD330]|uniref:hypothetical protein n=1 Tax=Paenibacillus sp. RUD330 TaxID=2023772 RepID=UPI000B927374|nr:hypothetical protein [Paenibacillus sp. RUD330]ASS64710.1 hypothetical protein CIC07_00245 [Paenibacillus sp. RUD330]
MNKAEIEKRAVSYREQLGGKVIMFPVDELNPISLYAVCIHDGKKFFVYDKAVPVEEAASYIKVFMEALEAEGLDSDYSRDVRFISSEAQMKGHLTLRRLKKEDDRKQQAVQRFDEDFQDDGKGGKLISARGLISLSYRLMVEEKNPVATEFMNNFFRLLQTRRYGKTAAAIKQELRRMSLIERDEWINRIYSSSRYIQCAEEVFALVPPKN